MNIKWDGFFGFECEAPILLGYDLCLQGCHLQGVAVQVATGETSQAITPFLFFDNSHFHH